MKKIFLLGCILSIPFLMNSQEVINGTEKLSFTEQKTEDGLTDDDSFNHNYAMGLRNYNAAVSTIQRQGKSDPELTLEELQDQCFMLFRKALPYFEACYAANPSHTKTLEALSGIHFALNDIEKSKKFQEELQQAKKNTSN